MMNQSATKNLELLQVQNLKTCRMILSVLFAAWAKMISQWNKFLWQVVIDCARIFPDS